MTASALSLPSRTNGMADSMVSNITVAWPPITSVSAGALPLYGTCVMRMPAMLLNSSAARWVDWPLPELAKVTWPGFALASAISAATLLAGVPGAVTSTSGPRVSRLTGAKSLRVS
ncbi:hypothetical protein D3C72_1889240 [compost metagenome]